MINQIIIKQIAIVIRLLKRTNILFFICVCLAVLGLYSALHNALSTHVHLVTVIQHPTPTHPNTIPLSLRPTTIVLWKTYISPKVGYSLKAPPQWKVYQYENNSILEQQEYATNMILDANYPGEHASPDDPEYASITIIFPISIQGPHEDIAKTYEHGLKGLEKFSTWGADAVLSSTYTQIEGHTALIVKSKSAVNPPSTLRGASWCSACSEKYVYIDLGYGKILTIEGYWGNQAYGFEMLFDKVISTIHLIRY